MRERIRELADEAAKFSAVMALPTGESGDQLFVEEFAELIVEECADLCESFGESGDGYTCSAEILEHFGVKE